MLSVFFTIVAYLIVVLFLIGYLYISIIFLFEDSELLGHSINIIIFSFLLIFCIFLLAAMGRFDSAFDASNLLMHVEYIFKSIWTGIYYGLTEPGLPAVTIFLALFTTPVVILVIVFNFFAQIMKGKGYDMAKREIKQVHYDESQARVKCEEAIEARREAEVELDSVGKNLKKKRLQLAETSSRLLKYTKFWDENKDKVATFDSKLKVKDSKITELEEIVKRRDLQIQRLKKARKNSEAN